MTYSAMDKKYFLDIPILNLKYSGFSYRYLTFIAASSVS